MRLYIFYFLLNIIFLLSEILGFVSASVPWNKKELFKTPSYEIVYKGDGVVGIVYKSVMYRGREKDVFAYYSTPGILSNGLYKDKKLPAVVCVHGGGGRAFEEWVKLWAKRGYAAISMDLRGYGKDRVELENGFKEEEGQKTPTFRYNSDISEEWFYQAVSDVVKAHSLIRSFAEIDKERIALTGISWGGIITSLVSGLDNRFKCAVPVYGCGYLFETGSMAFQMRRQGDLVTGRWKEQYDPSLYVGKVDIPMLFINGTNDNWFYMDQWQKTTALVKDVRRSVRYKMVHGHAEGWSPDEIYKFIDKELGVNDKRIPDFNNIRIEGRNIRFELSDSVDSDKLYLLYSKSGNIDKNAEWNRVDLNPSDTVCELELPEGTTMFVLCVAQDDGCNFSSEVFFL